MLQVLIVEDVDHMRELLKQTLEGIPELEVSGSARNSTEGRLELVRRRPDLILLDEILPGESGLDWLIELATQGFQVILLTSMQGRTEPIPAGALGRIVKPGWKTLEQDRDRLRSEILAALGR
jgi:response regulator of citrate/malate metabolism